MPTKRSLKPAPVHHSKKWIEEHSKVRPSLLLAAWVFGLLAAFTFFCVVLAQTVRVRLIEQVMIAQSYEIERLSQRLALLSGTVDEICKINTATSSTDGVTSVPQAVLPEMKGVFTRGSLSPNGKMFAGYEDALKAKRGIAVETLDDHRIRHVVLFTAAQSTGAGTPYEGEMSVRWKDASTIEYDVLETVKGVQTKKTETVTIGF